MTTRVMTQYYDTRLKASGLRGTQFSVLAAVGETGPVSVSRLAEGLMMDRTTVTRDIKPLEKQGFIAISQGEDRRQRLLNLTDTGKAVLESAAPLWEAAQEDIYRSLGKKSWKRLMADLDLTAQVVARRKSGKE